MAERRYHTLHKMATKLLLDRGDIEVYRKDYRGRTPLSYAGESGQIGTKKLLSDRPGIDPDSTDKLNRSPLFYAAVKGHIEVLELLLRRNVHLNWKDNVGQTALHTSAEKGHTEATKLLIKHDGVDINSHDK
ncbi:ankyrin repeat-containing domain protein [Pyronema domesticum]|nr:ankyrin repeat-containing domain protein [Pyronema domesticum]